MISVLCNSPSLPCQYTPLVCCSNFEDFVAPESGTVSGVLYPLASQDMDSSRYQVLEDSSKKYSINHGFNKLCSRHKDFMISSEKYCELTLMILSRTLRVTWAAPCPWCWLSPPGSSGQTPGGSSLSSSAACCNAPR